MPGASVGVGLAFNRGGVGGTVATGVNYLTWQAPAGRCDHSTQWYPAVTASLQLRYVRGWEVVFAPTVEARQCFDPGY